MNERIRAQIVDVLVEEEKHFWQLNDRLLQIAQENGNEDSIEVIEQRLEEELITIGYDSLLWYIENGKISIEDFKGPERSKDL